MEMLSPQEYKNANKDKSLQELMTLKEQLQSEIVSLSQNQDKDSIFLSDTRLQMKQQYFDKIWELIKEKREKLNEVKNLDKEEYEERRKFFEERIYDKTCFFIEINSGAVIPIFNPNYYNRVEISLSYDYRTPQNKVLIHNKEYSIKEEQFKRIQQMVEENFSKLIEITKNQKPNDIAGTYNTIRIKLGSIFLDISEYSVSSEEEQKYLIEFEEQIINILSVATNETKRYVYDEDADNKWIKEIINNTLNSIQENTNNSLNKDINSTINELVNKIIELPKGTEISISSLLGEKFKEFSTSEMFEINKNVLSICKEKGIVFNFDKYKDQAVGLPFNIPFIIE